MSEQRKRRQFLADMLFAGGGLALAAVGVRAAMADPQPQASPSPNASPTPSRQGDVCPPKPKASPKPGEPNYPVPGGMPPPKQLK